MSDLRMSLAVDANNPVENDLYLDSTGNVELADSVQAIAQHVKIRVQHFKGEWFLNQDEGIPYADEIFVKAPQSQVVRSIFRQAIITTPGVDDIESMGIELDRKERVLKINATIITDEGAVLSTSEFGPFVVEI